MTSLWKRFGDDLSVPRNKIGASVFRVVAGAGILLEYLCDYHQRHYLLGPNGIYPLDSFVHSEYTFSLFGFSASPLVFEVVYHAGILVALLWFLGLRTRWLTPLLYVLWVSIQHRLGTFGDGGDNILSICLLYGCFADLGAHFSIETRGPVKTGPLQDIAGMLHNAAILAFALQISLVYGVAGLTKVQGEVWRNGTALYYALANPDFKLPGTSEVIYHNGVLLTLLSYATVGFQVSFPWLLFLNRYSRISALVLGILFHIGIATVMGLVTFASFMMAVDLALIADDEYRVLARALGRASRWTRARLIAVFRKRVEARLDAVHGS